MIKIKTYSRNLFEYHILEKNSLSSLVSSSTDAFIVFNQPNSEEKEIIPSEGSCLSIWDHDIPYDVGDMKAMTFETALKIEKFIYENKDKNFHIACSAGISRSGAVAAYIGIMYGPKRGYTLTDLVRENPCILPNTHIFSLLVSALTERVMSNKFGEID